MVCSNHRRVWRCLLIVLLVTVADSLPRSAAVRLGVEISSSSSNRAILQLAAAASRADNAKDTITVPRLSLGSILTSIVRWPTSVFSDNNGLPLPPGRGRVGDDDDDDNLFITPSQGGDAAEDATSDTDDIDSLTTNQSLSEGMLQPLTDAGFAAINRLLSGNESSDGPYNFDTGMPSLETLVSVDATHPETVKTLSADRIEHLGQLQQPLGWVVRSFTISGDALLKLRLTHNLQLIIREVISSSVSDSTAVPEEQVLTFAAANITISLEIQGVEWTDKAAAGHHGALDDSNPALKAVRNAVSRIAGGFDPEHISVSLDAPAAAATLVAAPAEQLLQAPAISSSSELQQQPVTVYSTLYSVDPANTTSLLLALATGCSSSGTNSDDVDSPFPAMTAFVPGTPVTPTCLSVFRREFKKQGIAVSDQTFAVTVPDRPVAAVDLSVAVGLTGPQTLDKLHLRTSEWLNSSALSSIFSEFNLTVVPRHMTEFVLDPVTGTFPELSGMNVSSLVAKAAAGARGAGAAEEVSSSQPAQPAAKSKGLIAGVTVAAVTSVLALAGVLGLLVRNRRAAAAQAASDDRLPTTGDGDGGESRRRRRRPRLYHNKYLSNPAAAASSSVASLPVTEPDTLVAPQQVKLHLERGDSVSSAVKFEADEQQTSEGEASASESSAVAADEHTQSNDSSNAADKSSSSSGDAGGTLPQQRVLEMQQLCAQEHYAKSCAASAYSLSQDRAGTSSLHHLISISTSSMSTSTDLLLHHARLQSGAAAREDGEDCLQQTLQGDCPLAAPYIRPRLASTTTTPPATPVSTAEDPGISSVITADVTTAPLVASHNGSSTSQDAVQPLGASCWHQAGHASGFKVPEAVAAYRQPVQQPIGQEQHQSASGWLSPFSFVEQQQQRVSSGGGSVSETFAQQQQQRVRHSTGSHALTSPFASEREQQRVSGCGVGNVVAGIARHHQQQEQQQEPAGAGSCAAVMGEA